MITDLLHTRLSSAFDYGLWDLYDHLSLLEFSKELREVDGYQREDQGRSFVADAVFALNGCTPKPDDPVGRAWSEVMASDVFRKLRRSCKDRVAQASIVMQLADMVEESVSRAENPGQHTDGEWPIGVHAQTPEEQALFLEAMLSFEPDPGREADEKPKWMDYECKNCGSTGSIKREYVDEFGNGECGNCGHPALMTAGDEKPKWADYECKACGSTGSVNRAYVDEHGEECPECGHSVLAVAAGESIAAVALPSDLDNKLKEIEAEAVLIKTLGASMTGGPPERFEKALELSERFDVTEFAKFLGWTKRVVGGESRRTRGGADEMTGYDSGQWSDRVVPDQMLGVAEGRIDALAALADNSLTRRQFDADRPSGRGPVVLLRDESGSMGPECNWVRHRSALAFELALAEAFNREGRDLISVAWSSSGTRAHTYGKPGLENHLSSFLGGGTRIEESLRKAVEFADEYASRADILILTDGELYTGRESSARISQTIRPFRESGGRVWAISLAVSDERLDFTDGHIHIDRLAPDDDRVGGILEAMTRQKTQERRIRL